MSRRERQGQQERASLLGNSGCDGYESPTMYTNYYAPSPLSASTSPTSSPFLSSAPKYTSVSGSSAQYQQLTGDVPLRAVRDEDTSRPSGLVILLLLAVAGLSIAIIVLLSRGTVNVGQVGYQIEKDLEFITNFVKQPKCDCKQVAPELVVDSKILHHQCTQLMSESVANVLQHRHITSIPCDPVACTAMPCITTPSNCTAVSCTPVNCEASPCFVDQKRIHDTVSGAVEQAFGVLLELLKSQINRHMRCNVKQVDGSFTVACSTDHETISTSLDIPTILRGGQPVPRQTLIRHSNNAPNGIEQKQIVTNVFHNGRDE